MKGQTFSRILGVVLGFGLSLIGGEPVAASSWQIATVPILPVFAPDPAIIPPAPIRPSASPRQGDPGRASNDWSVGDEPGKVSLPEPPGVSSGGKTLPVAPATPVAPAAPVVTAAPGAPPILPPPKLNR